MKKGFALFLVAAAFLAIHPIPLCAELIIDPSLTGPENIALVASLGTGTAIGLAADVFYVWAIGTSWATPHPAVEPWVFPTLAGVMILTQTLSAGALPMGAAYAYMKLKVNPWASVPVGAAFGAVAGGLSLGLTAAIGLTLGTQTGAIVTGPEAWVGRVGEPWWENFLGALLGGFIFGGFCGACAGAVMGPILSFSLGY
jgi:hypothetical protein